MTTTVSRRAAKAPLQGSDHLDQSFARTVLIGCVAGFPVFFLLSLILLRAVSSSIDWWAIIGFACIGGIVAGVMLGGAIGVGVWSAKHEHDLFR